jgi:hypothetical protein
MGIIGRVERCVNLKGARRMEGEEMEGRRNAHELEGGEEDGEENGGEEERA